MNIRPASRGDVDELVPLWLSFIETGAYPVLTGATAASIRTLLEGLFAAEDRSCLRVVEDRGGHLVGGLAFVEEAHPMTGDRYADQVCWGVQPVYRTSVAGPQLFAALETWAQARGVRVIRTRAPMREPDSWSSFRRFYEARGFEAIETTFVKEVR